MECAEEEKDEEGNYPGPKIPKLVPEEELATTYYNFQEILQQI